MDAIEALIDEAPTPAIVATPEAQAAYDPDQTYATPPTPTAQPAVNCLFVRVSAEALQAEHTATATFKLADLPASVRAETHTALIDGVTYTIVKVQKRYREGVQNGWTLLLK